jgi:AraC-like DNA-binding protein
MSRQDTIGFVRAGVYGNIKHFLARYPLKDADRLLREAGVDPEHVRDHDALVSLRATVAFMESAAAETGDDSLGLEYGAQLPWKDLGVLGYVMFNSPTVGQGLENCSRFYSLQQTLGKLSLSQVAHEARVSYALVGPGLGPTTQLVDTVLAFLVRYCREAPAQPGWAPQEVRFERGAPSDQSRHRRFFVAPLRFRQSENAFIFPAKDLERPVKSADPDLLSILQRYAEEVLARMPSPDDFSATVRRIVTSLLSTGNVDIEDVASRLELNPRTLQRRLQDSGTTYQELLGDTRLELARRYLKDESLSLTDTAFLLGYSDLSAFSRAFHRWTGQGPLAFRRGAKPK